MEREEKVELGGKMLEIKMNKVNYVIAFTYGGIWYTGTNCTTSWSGSYIFLSLEMTKKA